MKKLGASLGLGVIALSLFPFVAFAQTSGGGSGSQARPSCILNASPTVVRLGATSLLSWDSINATGGTITSIGHVASVGKQGVIPTKTTTYVGTFIGSGGTTTCSVVVMIDTGAGVGGSGSFDAAGGTTGGTNTSGGSNDFNNANQYNNSNTFQSNSNFNATAAPGSPGAPGAAPTIPIQPAGQGLVPCNGIDCQLCSLAALSQRIINFLIGLSIPIAVALFAYAGFLYFTSSVVNNLDKARKLLMAGAVGFLIAISAWLVVQTLMKTILSNQYQNWNTIQCVSNRPVATTLAQLLNSIPALTQVERPGPGSIAPSSGYTLDQNGNVIPTGPQPGVTPPSGFVLDKDGNVVPSGDSSSIAAAAEAYFNTDTSGGPPATEAGNKACAWAVNNILQNAGIDPIDGLSVASMEQELINGRGTYSGSNTDLSQTQGGDIVIWKTDTMSHVGICLDSGCTQVLSNSSGDARFDQRTDAGFNKGVTARIYHVNK